jgi:hypothetical protein
MTTTDRTIEKSPKTPWDSVALSLFCCGAGQINNGDTMKGVILLPVALTAYGLGLLFLMSFAAENPPTYDRFFRIMRIIGVIWAFNIIDAYRVAARIIKTRAAQGRTELPLHHD